MPVEEKTATKTTATVTIVHEPGTADELTVTCEFDPKVEDDKAHVAGSLAMIAVKAISEACKREPAE